MSREIKNARILSTMLGTEDHGILTAMISLEYGGSGQGFGGYSFGNATSPVVSGFGMEFVRQVLRVAGVEKWEDLKGKPVRADAEFGKVHRLGHYLDDKWFDPAAVAVDYARLVP